MRARFLQSIADIFSPVLELIWPIVRISLLVLELLAAGAFIYFVGGISLRASLAIAILFIILWIRAEQNLGGIREIYDLSSKPYRVCIRLHIERMLFDLGLVTAEWESPYPESGLPPYPWTPLHTLSWGYGINAVVLSSDSSPKLVHWTGPNFYTKRIEYSQRLDFLKFPHPILKDLDPESEWSPEFFFRRELDGYHIGIRVLNDWWSDNKERLEMTGIVKSIDDSDEADGGRTRITLAILPDKVFYPLDFKRQTEKAKQKRIEEIKKELPLAGWKVEAPWSPWGEREIGINGEAEYVSDYAEVCLRHLE
jgi:hypothetical protein